MKACKHFLPVLFLLVSSQAPAGSMTCEDAGQLINQSVSEASAGKVKAYLRQGVCLLKFAPGVQLAKEVDLREAADPVVLQYDSAQPATVADQRYDLIKPAASLFREKSLSVLIPVPSPRAGSGSFTMETEFPRPWLSDNSEPEWALSPAPGFDGEVLIVLPEKSAIPDYFPVHRQFLKPFSSGCYAPGIAIGDYSGFIDLSGLAPVDSGIPGCDASYLVGQPLSLSGQPRAVPGGKKGGRMGRHTRKKAFGDGKEQESEGDTEDKDDTSEQPRSKPSGSGGEKEPPDDQDKKKSDHESSVPMKQKSDILSKLTEDEWQILVSRMRKLAKKSRKEDFVPENNQQQFQEILDLIRFANGRDMERIRGMQAYQILQPYLKMMESQRRQYYQRQKKKLSTGGAEGKGPPGDRGHRQHPLPPSYTSPEASDEA